MNLMEDEHLDVCQNIECGLKKQYELNPLLTDAICIFALENAKIAIKKQYGFAKKESVTDMAEAQGIIQWCIDLGLQRIDKINHLTLKEYVGKLDKVRKSMIRHSAYGRRGYYEFIRNFV